VEEYRKGASSVIDLMDDVARAKPKQKNDLQLLHDGNGFQEEEKQIDYELQHRRRALVRKSKRLKRDQQQYQSPSPATSSSVLTLLSKGRMLSELRDMSVETADLLTRYWSLNGCV
jgi:hypothetical protein